MQKIARIEGLLTSATNLLRSYETKLRDEPDNFFYQGLVKNTREHIEELTIELVQEKSNRDIEILELRLIGKAAKYGTLPLDILGKLTTQLSDAIIYSSKQIRSGSKQSASALQEVKRTLDLRFAGTASGSTRIYITGQTSPDLFGDSLIEKSFENTFSLLNANSSEELLESASKCGTQSLRNLKKFLSTVDSNALEIDIVWDSASDKTFSWEGDKEKIQTMTNSLSNIIVESPKEHEIEAVLITSSLKGTFEVKDKDKKIYRGRYPTKILEQIKEIRIGDDCYCLIEETCTSNRTTNQKKYSYLLKSIEPLDVY